MPSPRCCGPVAPTSVRSFRCGRRLRARTERGLSADRPQDLPELRSVRVEVSRHLVLISWRNLLDRAASEVGAAGDVHTETDIRQLRGLAGRQDEEAFLPLRREEFAPEIPRRLLGLRRLIDDATNQAREEGFVDTNGLKVASQWWGYGRYVRIVDQTAWFGIHANLWARRRSTPLWLWFWDRDSIRLDSLEDLVLPATDSHDRFVPIYLPVGKEYNALLNAVVMQLEEIGELIRS